MATWIEIRCERRGGGKLYFIQGNYVTCRSDTNDGPMEMAEDNQKSVLAVLRVLDAEAKASGWKKTKDGWVCPLCLYVEQHNLKPYSA